MDRRALFYAIPSLVFLGLVGVVAWFMLSGKDPNRIPSPLIDKPVPQFALPGLDGGSGFSSADLRDGVTVVNAFASWCVPCRAEHPQITALSEMADVRVYGLSYKDDAADSRAWLDDLGDPYAAVGHDPEGKVAIELGVYGVPETFVIDPDGRVRYRHVANITEADLEQCFRPLIAALAAGEPGERPQGCQQ